MHFELENILKIALAEKVCPSLASVFHIADVHTLLGAVLATLEVGDCPPNQNGVITSTIAFQIANVSSHLLPPGEGNIPKPEALAQSIQVLFREQYADKFSCEIGGGAHLNFTPHPLFGIRFLEEVLNWKNDEEAFGSLQFFREHPQNLPKLTLDVEDLRARLRIVLGEDGAKAIDSFFQITPPGSEAEMMILGLLADREIDERVYLKRLAGRQNLPWHFRRYRLDALRWAKQLEAKRVGSESVVTDLETFPEYAQPTMMLIYSFRRKLFLALRESRPERIFGHLIDMTRDFYRLFNHPTFRGLKPGDFDAEEYLFLERLNSSLLHLVELGMTVSGIRDW